nr:hypothetical protein CFP56_78344 [Quercus suber]
MGKAPLMHAVDCCFEPPIAWSYCTVGSYRCYPCPTASSDELMADEARSGHSGVCPHPGSSPAPLTLAKYFPEVAHSTVVGQ